MSEILISLVDDQQLFRSGLAGLIRSVEGFALLSEAENGRVFIDQLAAGGPLPHIALIDMHMPEMNGVELNEMLQKKYPSIKVLILSVYDQERFIGKMIEAGACGYLTKNCEIEELITDGGEITLGALAPFDCVASAADGSNALAMLVRRDGETLPALLKRLDRAIAAHYDDGRITDEVNAADD